MNSEQCIKLLCLQIEMHQLIRLTLQRLAGYCGSRSASDTGVPMLGAECRGLYHRIFSSSDLSCISRVSGLDER